MGPKIGRTPGTGPPQHPGHQGRGSRRAFENAALPGSRVHDEIAWSASAGFSTSPTGRGLEGGMSNGDLSSSGRPKSPIATLRPP